jgi:hypothetical protein
MQTAYFPANRSLSAPTSSTGVSHADQSLFVIVIDNQGRTANSLVKRSETPREVWTFLREYKLAYIDPSFADTETEDECEEHATHEQESVRPENKDVLEPTTRNGIIAWFKARIWMPSGSASANHCTHWELQLFTSAKKLGLDNRDCIFLGVRICYI